MLNYPDIDPIALSLGPLTIHWYGLMYLLAFACAYFLLQYRARLFGTQQGPGFSSQQVSDLLFHGCLGVILGGRAGYFLFYIPMDTWLSDPLSLFKIWQGGMSFHGGLIGVLVVIGIWAKKQGCSFFKIADFVAPVIPLGLAFGRLGNFIGNELWGRTAPGVPWAMVFPGAGPLPRHPSQLYQMALEGLVLFGILWIISRKARPVGLISGVFLLGYGLARFTVEFFRAPDAHIGFIALDWVTMGHLLSLPMMLAGVCLVTISLSSNQRLKALL